MILLLKPKTPPIVLYTLPIGAEILWYGVASELSSDFQIDADCGDEFVMGADEGEASNIEAGANEHTHTNPSTNVAGAHQHTTNATNTGASLDDTSASTSQSPSAENGSPPHSHSIPATTSDLQGGHQHTSSTPIGDTRPAYAMMYWIKALVETVVPVNGVLMWQGNMSSAPGGFVLCNGDNGTLDLRNKFVFGAAEDLDVGTVGGSNAHIHEGGNTAGAGLHDHYISASSGISSSLATSGYEGEVVADVHTHGVSCNDTPSDANHVHALGDTEGADSLPPYLMLYYIMRME